MNSVGTHQRCHSGDSNAQNAYCRMGQFGQFYVAPRRDQDICHGVGTIPIDRSRRRKRERALQWPIQATTSAINKINMLIKNPKPPENISAKLAKSKGSPGIGGRIAGGMCQSMTAFKLGRTSVVDCAGDFSVFWFWLPTALAIRLPSLEIATP